MRTVALCAVAAALLFCPRAGLAVETEWRFDAQVSAVSGIWNQSIAVGAPVHGLVVLERGQSFVPTGDPCDGSATRAFYSVRAAQFNSLILPDAQRRIDTAQRAYAASRSSFAAVLAARRAVLDTQLQQLKLVAESARAQVRLQYLVGQGDAR